MNRAEHLKWAKERALEYVENGDLKNAMVLMVSDLKKHNELANHPAIGLGAILLMAGHLSTQAQMRDFIERIN